MTCGFVSARSPCLLRNIQRKQCRCRLGNHQRNNFQRRRVDSEELIAPVDSEKVNENGVGATWEIISETPSKGDTLIWKRSLALVDSEKVKENGVGAHWEIVTETPSKGDAWIWKRRSPCWLQKSERNNFQRWRVDSEELAAPVD